MVDILPNSGQFTPALCVFVFSRHFLTAAAKCFNFGMRFYRLYFDDVYISAGRFEHACVAYDKQAAKYAVAYSQLDKFQADRTPR